MSQNRFSQLLTASLRGNYETALALLSEGADVNERNPYGGVTPLINAAYSGNVDLVRLFLTYGADPRPRAMGGVTAAIMASQAREARPDLEANYSEIINMLSMEEQRLALREEQRLIFEEERRQRQDLVSQGFLPMNLLDDCSICLERLLHNPENAFGVASFFNCAHGIHEACYSPELINACPLCRAPKKYKKF